MKQIYEDGTYLVSNPSWHEEDSLWKAEQIIRIIERNSLTPARIGEIGCGAGEILNRLSQQFGERVDLSGYEISPQAFELCRAKTSNNLTFHLGNLLDENDAYFDILLAIDVFEHVEDYFEFLRKLKPKAEYKVFHVPLDLSVQTVLRATPIMKVRRLIGHLHYFTKETALETLKDAGYEVIDSFYTASGLELPNRGWKANLLRFPRRLAFAFHKDLTVRILGGYSLLILAK